MMDFVCRQVSPVVTARIRLAGMHCDERGQGLVDYALILIVVSTAALFALQGVRSAVFDMYSTVSTAVASAIP